MVLSTDLILKIQQCMRKIKPSLIHLFSRTCKHSWETQAVIFTHQPEWANSAVETNYNWNDEPAFSSSPTKYTSGQSLLGAHAYVFFGKNTKICYDMGLDWFDVLCVV